MDIVWSILAVAFLLVVWYGPGGIAKKLGEAVHAFRKAARGEGGQ